MNPRTIHPRRGNDTAFFPSPSGGYRLFGDADPAHDPAGADAVMTTAVVAADPEMSMVETVSGTRYIVRGAWPDLSRLPRVGGAA